MAHLVLVAIGGNALIRPGHPMTAEQEFERAVTTATEIVKLIKSGHRVVLTHGNGPQVGAALVRSELAAHSAYRLPVDCCVATTQGEVGYILQYAMGQVMRKEGLTVPVVSLVTQVLVERNDRAFRRATKPIGPFYKKEVAAMYSEKFGWEMDGDESRGYRRVVPSPEPKEIIELDAIRACVERGLVVIAGGGGGIPVFNDHELFKGVEAVIDKDLTSAILASQLDADLFVVVTGEEYVYIDYKKPTQRAMPSLTDVECRQYMSEGQFPEGTMSPKIQAALMYLERGGQEAIITDIRHLHSAVNGEAGTHIRMSDEMIEWP